MHLTTGNFIDGTWEAGDAAEGVLEVTDPRSATPVAWIAYCTAAQVDSAVSAARRAFAGWAATPLDQRIAVLRRVADLMQERTEELADAVTSEIGAPAWFARKVQVGMPLAALRATIDQLETLEFEETVGNSRVFREPVGVAAAITPWNYPIYQVIAKIAPALGAGCTVVVKPAGIAPLSVIQLFQVLEDAGVPAGVANLVVGRGSTVGEQLVSHPDVDIVSFTGSTEIGARIAELAGRGVKRVTLELGGKSAGVLLPGADIEAAAAQVVGSAFSNSGQTCSALTRMIVPRDLLPQVEQAVAAAASRFVTRAATADQVEVGPLASRDQQQVVGEYIASGIVEGARVLIGGTVLDGDGAYVSPTVFTDVRREMRIAREEIFGPVLVIIPVDSEEEAVAVANDTEYGLSGAVWSADDETSLAVARRMHTGQVSINGGTFNPAAPFGGVKKSGYGRELGKYGLEEYLTLKSVQLKPSA